MSKFRWVGSFVERVRPLGALSPRLPLFALPRESVRIYSDVNGNNNDQSLVTGQYDEEKQRSLYGVLPKLKELYHTKEEDLAVLAADTLFAINTRFYDYRISENHRMYAIKTEADSHLDGKLVVSFVGSSGKLELREATEDEISDPKAIIAFAGKDTGGKLLPNIMKAFGEGLFSGKSVKLLGYYHREKNPYKRDTWAAEWHKNKNYASPEVEDFANEIVKRTKLENSEISVMMSLNFLTFSAGSKFLHMVKNEAVRLLEEQFGDKFTDKIREEFLSYWRVLSFATAPDYKGQKLNFGLSLGVSALQDMGAIPGIDVYNDLYFPLALTQEKYRLNRIFHVGSPEDYLLILGNDTIPAEIDGKPNLFGHNLRYHLGAVKKHVPANLWNAMVNFHEWSVADVLKTFSGAKRFNPEKDKNFGLQGREEYLEGCKKQLEGEAEARKALEEKKKDPNENGSSKSSGEKKEINKSDDAEKDTNNTKSGFAAEGLKVSLSLPQEKRAMLNLAQKPIEKSFV